MESIDWSPQLAFVHPAWMVASIGVAVFTARLGLEIRRRRVRGEPPGRDLRERHLRTGKWAIAMIVVGFAGGPPSMIFVRHESGFESFHAILGIITLGLALWTGWTGRALAGGDPEARDVHRVATAGLIGASLISAIAGFTLLP